MASQNQSGPAEVCPVDHKAREAWLKQAKAQNPSEPTPASPHAPLQASSGCDSSTLDQAPTPSATAPSVPSTASILGSLRLGTQREVSTIPRSGATPDAAPASPANNERETGADKKTGNWIYPSEQMFFDAMKRKAYNPEQADMKTIVPIHNAVNERAWKEIKEWEKGRGSERYVLAIS
jgi:cytochrome c heme-lyase